MRPRLVRPPSGEDGVALFYVLLVTLVVGGIVAVVIASAMTENKQAALELDFEDTVHIAEAGAEALLQELKEDNEFNSGVAGPGAGDPATWAVNEALREDGSGYVHDKIDLGEGEVVALRPNDDDAEFIYGVGFTPSREAYDDGLGDPYVRVVRVQVAFTPSAFAADNALLAGGNLKMSGNFDIRGANGSVHSNGALDINGSSGFVEDGVTYSGSCKQDPCDGTSDVPVSGPRDPEPVPEVDILETWDTRPAELAAAAGEFYDYCSGVWYQRGESDPAPCTGTQLGTAGNPFPADWPWMGTTFEGVDGASGVTGTYFFRDDVDLDVKRPNGSVTFITGGDISIGPSANAPTLDGHLPGIFMLAEGDILLKANFDAAELQTPAVIMANGTLTFAGNPDTVNVAFIAVDELKSGSEYKGTGTVRYDGGALPDFGGGGVPVVVQWDEIREP